ncbi:hypothetical protein [Nonomuraea lactucae]|uniref:hypothetical protein n=1 Tax=Nonomuraea lactucae TaxID=2249762 RepID=UPI000DE36582|nr:hypothetical protein [Nonomuraea lactucae]
MADSPSPGPAERGTRRGYALAVAVAGASLVVSAILPWAGVEARSDLLGGGVSSGIRGVDAGLGVYTLVAGLAALALGVAGGLGRPWIAALAVVPGGLATALLVMFVADPRGLADRVSLDLGRVLSVEPVIRYGWFAALAASLAVVLFAVLTVLRRS